MDGRRGSEGTGWSGDVEKRGQVWRDKAVNGHKCVDKSFEFYSELEWEPVELLKDGVMWWGEGFW